MPDAIVHKSMQSCFLLQLALLSWCALSSESPALADDERVQRGFQSLERLQCDRAILQVTPPFINAMRLGTPQSRADAARYLTLIGSAFNYDNNVQSYLSSARMALLLDPASPHVIAFAIEAFTRASKFDEAQSLVERYKPLGEKNAYMARSISGYLRAIGEQTEGDKFLNLATTLNPDDPYPYIARARNTSSTEEARINYLAAAQRCQAGSYHREFWLWCADREEKGTNKKLEHLVNASKILPDDPSWKAQMAFVKVSQGKADEAVENFLAAAQSPRLSLKALGQLGALCAYSQRPQLARQAADRLVALAPQLPESYLARAHVENASGDAAGAERDFRKAIAISPSFSMAYDSLRWLPEYSQGKQTGWLAKEWVSHCPSKVDAWLFAAEYDRAQNKWSEARAKYKQAEERLRVSTKPLSKLRIAWCRAYAGAGTCAYRLKDYEEAARCARGFNARKPVQTADFIRVRPSEIDFSKLIPGSKPAQAAEHVAIADMLYENGQLDDCINEYKQAIALDDKPDWHRGLLKAYMDKHDYSAAMGEDIVVSNDTVTRDLPAALDKMSKQFTH